MDMNGDMTKLLEIQQEAMEISAVGDAPHNGGELSHQMLHEEGRGKRVHVQKMRLLRQERTKEREER